MKRTGPISVVFALVIAAIAASAFPQQRTQREEPAGLSRSAAMQIEELLAEKESRTSAQRKLDSQLIYALKAKRGQRISAHVEALDHVGRY